MFRGIVVVCALLVGCDTPERPADWNYIQAGILRPNCATAACHSDITRQSGLNLSTADAAYISLLRKPCGSTADTSNEAGVNVDPGHPETSALVYWLRGIENPVMPPDTPLPEVEIDAVERWILEGATCE